METTDAGSALGINGLGRIGKLTLWHHVARRHFDRLVVNVGREVGTGLEAVCDAIEYDSTYGALHRFLHGVDARPCVRILDHEDGLIEVDGVPVTILRRARDPREIDWRAHRVRVVVDATGAFGDPSRPADAPGGSLRGHLLAGAEKVIYSAAFKNRGGGRLPDDAVTLIYGVNHESFDPRRHDLISAASCTTTALAHMVKPLLDRLDPASIMTASMSTVHAATNSQSLLDSLPRAGASDLRRTRSALNSIILTSTNAATTLELVIPEIRDVGFMADSVRIPMPTESLIILNLTFQTRIENGSASVTREVLNDAYAESATDDGDGLLVYSERQNVPADVAAQRAAVVIEGVETHTRTGFVTLDLAGLPGLDPAVRAALPAELRVPVTHAKVFGWYDNEYGSYTNLLGDLTAAVHRALD